MVATKGFGATGEGPNGRGASRYHLIDACKASLKRLQLDHVDLYQIHGFDTATPIEETLRALDTLVQHGHVRYIGVSNWAAWQIAKALGLAERLGLHRFASLQAYYTLVGRDLEREIAPMLLSEEVGLMVWSPLAGGYLSGKYSAGGAADGRPRRVRFPAGRPGSRRCRGRRDAPDRRSAGYLGGAGCPRLVVAPARGNQRNRGCEAAPSSSRTIWPRPRSI